MSAAPLVVCVHHPADPDVDAIRRIAGDLARPLEIRVHPFKESVALRRARQSPPVDPALLAKAPAPDAATLETWQRAEVLLTLDLPLEWLERMPALRWVQAYSAGLEQIPVASLEARGIALTNAAGAGAGPIAEFVFGRLVEVFRNLRAIETMQRERAFHRPGGRSLAGRTLGVVGLGAIGTACAKLARAFGMRVIATRRSARPGDASEWTDELHGPEGLPRLLSESDVVVLAAPATAETAGLIDAAALARMRPGAVLCNVARGALVDEAALRAALETGRLGAAILDVTRREPLPADDPLWSAPNLYLSPHCSIPPDAYDERLLALFAENLRAWDRGDALRNRIV